MPIRRARAEDARALSAFAERTFVETFGAQNRPEDMRTYRAQTYSEEKQRAELSDEKTITLISETHVGAGFSRPTTFNAFAMLRLSAPPPCITGESPIEIVRFYVDHAWHGRGIARELMQAVDETAISAGARTIWLGVWERNDRAIAFYKKCGFERVGSQPFILGSDIQTDHVMMRSIKVKAET